jgi:hypothetical protein
LDQIHAPDSRRRSGAVLGERDGAAQSTGEQVYARWDD